MTNAVWNSVSWAITPDVERGWIDPFKWIQDIARNTVDGTIWVWTDAIADVAIPATLAVKNILHMVNPMSYARNGVWNIYKAPLAALAQWTSALSNIPAWVASWIHQAYKKLVSNNVQYANNWTFANIPYVWAFVWKLWTLATAVPAIAPAILDWLARAKDMWTNALTEATLLEGQTNYVSRLRV